MKFPMPVTDKDSGAVMAIYPIKFQVSRENRETKQIERRTLLIRPARREEVPAVVRLYNSVLDPTYERGLEIESAHIKSRLQADPESVLLGFLEGSELPVSLINIITLLLSSLRFLPTSHQELTGDDSWKPNQRKGNVKACLWVATDKEQGRGWKGEFGGKPRSLGQLQVLAVAIAALQAGTKVDALVAYSRPAELRQYIENIESIRRQKLKLSFPDDNRMVLGDRIELKPDKRGLYHSGPHGIEGRLIEMKDYWAAMTDKVLRCQARNGARFDPDLVYPNGHKGDRNACRFRTGLPYKISDLLASAA